MALRLLLICLSVIQVLSDIPWGCAIGFQPMASECYLLLQEPVTFFEARSACATVDGEVVQISSADAQQRVVSYMSTVSNPPSSVWLAATDLQKEGTWLYDSTLIMHAMEYYNAWVPGHPTTDITKNCAALSRGDGWKWTDVPCSYHQAVLCYRDLNMTLIVG